MEPNQNKIKDLIHVSDINQPPQSDINDSNINNADRYELILNWYRINSQKLLDEEIINDLPINILLKILGQPIWNNIYHCWSIEPKHMNHLQNYTQHQFNPEKFTYFIEVYHTS